MQEHAKRLTEGGRASTSHRFLNDLIQLLNSMKLWATNDGRMAVCKKEQKIDELFMRVRVTKLQKVSDLQSLLAPFCTVLLTTWYLDLHTAVQDCIATFHEALTDQLYDHFDRLIPTASASAVPTAT